MSYVYTLELYSLYFSATTTRVNRSVNISIQIVVCHYPNGLAFWEPRNSWAGDCVDCIVDFPLVKPQ